MPKKPQPLPKAKPKSLGLCPERTDRITDVLQREVDAGCLPGAVVLLARHGRVALHRAVGQLDPAQGSPMSTDAIFRIYSMTKPMVSVAVMMQVEQGRVLLDAPVHHYLPEYADPRVAVDTAKGVKLQPVARPATVHDLLRHTAGLTYEFLGASSVHRRYVADKVGARHRSNAEFSQGLAALPLLYPPGTQWAYSRATDVLGRLLEVVTGQTLGEHLNTAICQPLGMVDTGFSVPARHHHRIAEPFHRGRRAGATTGLGNPTDATPAPALDTNDVPAFDPRQAPAFESGGGGLMSTSADYARFLQCLLNRGQLDGVRLLGSATVDHMTADHLGGIPSHDSLLPPGHGFGLGFAVRTQAGVCSMPGSVGTYHWGGIAGTTFFVDPRQDCFGILMVQAPSQRDAVRALFRNLAYATLAD